MLTLIPFIYKDDDDIVANTYLLIDSSKRCVVIDPGKDNNNLLDYINNHNYSLVGVLLTHSHVDHMRGVNRLLSTHKCPLFVGFDDEIGLTDQEYNCGKYLNENIVIKAKANTVSDNEIIDIFEEKIKVIYTPFHTRGSVCYYFSNSELLFSGDTLFKGTIGRTDLSSSTRKPLKESLEKFKSLPDEVKVYPGHGYFRDIGFEKKNNPFLNR